MKYRIIIITAILGCFCGQSSAQGYFKWITSPTTSFTRKIARLPGNDIVLADATQSGFTDETKRGIWVSRLDECGREVWANRYTWKQNVLEFKDIAVGQSGDIFILGTAYEQEKEYIFLLRLNATGTALQFRLYQGGTIDLFTFSLDASGGRLLVSGLLLNWVTFKQGFYAVFDENLQFLSGKKVDKFESDGNAVFTPEGKVAIRSGPYFFQFAPDGSLDWAIQLTNVQGAYPVAGPYLTDEGYLFELYREEHGFFYVIDPTGALLWESDKFAATKHGASMHLLEDGSYRAIFSKQGVQQTALAQITVSPDGGLSDHKILAIDQELKAGNVFQSASASNVTVVGNGDVFAGISAERSGFLFQFQPETERDTCFYWETQTETPNDFLLDLAPLEINVSDFQPTVREESVLQTSIPWNTQSFCSTDTLTIVTHDSLLSCGTSWQLSLPSPSYRWDDAYNQTTRTITERTTISATNRDCIRPVRHRWTANFEVCPCPIFIPNVFSPDLDGQNDRLSPYSSCQFTQVSLRIFSRWGELVFSQQSPEVFWDGNYRGRPLPGGVYMAVAVFEWTDESGTFRQEQKIQDVLLVR